MAAIILIPAVTCWIVLATGSARKASLDVYLPVLNPAKSLEFTLKPGEFIFAPKRFARATYLFQLLNSIFELSSLAYLGAVL